MELFVGLAIVAFGVYIAFMMKRDVNEVIRFLKFKETPRDIDRMFIKVTRKRQTWTALELAHMLGLTVTEVYLLLERQEKAGRVRRFRGTSSVYDDMQIPVFERVA